MVCFCIGRVEGLCSALGQARHGVVRGQTCGRLPAVSAPLLPLRVLSFLHLTAPLPLPYSIGGRVGVPALPCGICLCYESPPVGGPAACGEEPALSEAKAVAAAQRLWLVCGRHGKVSNAWPGAGAEQGPGRGV